VAELAGVLTLLESRMTIIFGTSLRPDSEPLAEVAALLAERLQVPLRLVHVCDDPRAPLVIGTDQEHLLGSVRDDLVRQAQQLRQSTGATVQPHLASGPVVNALASLSEFELATALVVGTTTRRFRHIAKRLARTCRVPLIALREPARLRAWLRGERPLRALVGANLGRPAEAARAFAARLSALGPAEVEILFVSSPEETHARLALEQAPGRALSPEAEAALLRELSRAAPASETSATLRVVPGSGQADAQLVARAEQGEFDLIVIGLSRQSVVQQVWHGSIERRILQASPVSVACVPLPVGDTDVSFRPPQVVVVGTELTEIDHRALAHAVGYAEPGATVHVAHVLDAVGAPSDVRHAREDAWYQLQRLDRDRANERGITLQIHVLEGLPAEQLLALSERVGADLLVLGVRKRASISRALLGSLAGALMDVSRIPVLLVPAAPEA
jgi:nucleotide-binding universal stress UspA family protein